MAAINLRRLAKVAVASSLLGVHTFAYQSPKLLRTPIRSLLLHRVSFNGNPRTPRSLLPSDVAPASPVTAMRLASDTTAAVTDTGSTSKLKFDYDALTKYVGAVLVQCTLLFGFLRGIDLLVSTFSLKVPAPATFTLFYALSLKSRVFNPLANNRPKVKTLESGSSTAAPKRIMPTWTPPGVVFPIMWLLVIAPLRAMASTLVVSATSQYASCTIMALMAHLSIGDVWNTINNVERRYGVSVVGVALVWLSKAYAAFSYGRVVPRAGTLLALPLVWLTVASTLIYSTWKLNPDPATGQPEPLYPTVGEKKTKFVWFQST